jgi:hypothetical protein
MRLNGSEATRWAAALVVLLVVAHAVPALAQADPFAMAKQKACDVQAGLRQFAGAVGMLGMISCLMLGYFDKLNWRWLATGIGVSFALSTVPPIIGWAGGTPPC